MDTNTAMVLGVLFISLVVGFFFYRFKGSGKFRIKTKLGEATAEGQNHPATDSVPAGFKAKNVEVGGDLRTTKKSPGGVHYEGVKVKGNLETNDSTENSPPKL